MDVTGTHFVVPGQYVAGGGIVCAESDQRLALESNPATERIDLVSGSANCTIDP